MIEKKRIALFSTSFLPYSQTFIYDELKAHSNKYEVTVFCKTRINEDKFPYGNFYKPPNKMGEIFYQNRAYWPGFNKVFREKKFDLIHAHFGTGAVYALHYAKKFNIPLIVTFHGNDVASLLNQTKWYPKQLRYTLKIKEILSTMNIGLVVSKELIELLKDLGAEENKLKHFRLGINTDLFKPKIQIPLKPVRFITIGRFTEKKGHIYSLRAFKNVIIQGYDAKLTLVGDGELMQDCKNFVYSNGLDNAVDFTGVIDSNKISNLLKNSHVMLAHSVVTPNFDREGLPTVIKEALACEIPVISTYHGGIPELVDHDRVGYLTKERDTELLSILMIKFIKNENLIEKFGKEGRKKVLELYDIDKEILNLEKYYEQVITKSK